MIAEAILALIPVCAPNTSASTIQQIMQIVSSGNILAINVNGVNKKFEPQNQKEAAQIVREYIAAGYTVDVGLMQINSSNFAKLGYQNRIEALFEPCNNIAAGEQVFLDFYQQSSKIYTDSKQALLAAVSAYNTGDFKKGFRNGYVAKFLGKINSTKTVKNNKTKINTVIAKNNTDDLLRQAMLAPTAVNIDVLRASKK